MSNLAKARWDANHAVQDFRRRFLLANPHAQRLISQLYFSGSDALGLLQKNLAKTPVTSALELAGGRGDFALAMLRRNISQSVHLIDLSPKAAEVAREKASAQGFHNLSVEVQDCNKIALSQTYPLIIFSQSMHHIEALEHVISEIHQALDEGGVFFVNDYIGPSRMQWTDDQLRLMNAFLSLIPEHLRVRCDPGGGGPGTVKQRIIRLPVAGMIAADPSEGVRSAEIAALIRERFSDVAFYPAGGTITYELFRGIAHNFDNDPCAIALMKSIIIAEHELIVRGMPSDFGVFICRK